jgi:hypothetical protein
MRSLAPLSLPGLRWYQAFDASGIVPRLDRPSGNVTGFASNEASIGGKSLELLSEIAPGSSGPEPLAVVTPTGARPISEGCGRRHSGLPTARIRADLQG